MRILMSASAVSTILSAAMILFIGMTGAVFAGHHAAGEKAAPEMLVEKRIKRFKQSGADIQAIFKKHIAAGDYVAIEKAATRIADWADVMPNYFPAGSSSKGARAEIWDNFSDFEAKAQANAKAARAVVMAAQVADKKNVVAAARKMGGTCKSCHDSYRNKK